MRAIYLEGNFEVGKDIEVCDDKKHHLVNVVRCKVGDKILVLDGKGNRYEALIIDIAKKVITLKTEKKETIAFKAPFIDLALSQVKKDALDLSIKIAVELGIRNLYLVKTDFSQNYPINEKRLNKLIESAMEQSNNPYYLNIIPTSLSKFCWENYDKGFLFSSISDSDNGKVELGNKNIYFIGPEAGFSEKEESQLAANKKVSVQKLPTYILRAPTAVATCFGHLLGKV